METNPEMASIQWSRSETDVLALLQPQTQGVHTVLDEVVVAEEKLLSFTLSVHTQPWKKTVFLHIVDYYIFHTGCSVNRIGFNRAALPDKIYAVFTLSFD